MTPTADAVILNTGSLIDLKTIISALISFFLGFFTAGFWPWWRSKKEQKKILEVIERSLTLQLERANVNQNLIKQEIKLIENHKRRMEPIVPIETKVLDLLFSVQIPKKLLKNNEIFRKIMDIIHNNAEINSLIDTREKHVTLNGAFSQYEEVLKLIDQNLLIKLEKQMISRFKILEDIKKSNNIFLKIKLIFLKLFHNIRTAIHSQPKQK